jgi:hypothetical protein
MTILRFQCPLSSIRPNYIIKGRTLAVRLYDGNFYTRSTSIVDIGESISEFVNLINDLFRLAWLDYRSTHTLVGTNYSQPFLSYDPVTDLFSLIVPYFFNSDTGNNIDVQVNSTVFYYIAGIPAFQLYDGFYSFGTNIIATPVNDVEDKYYFCKYYNNAVQNSPYPPTGNTTTQYNAYRFQAEFSTSYRFNDFQSVLVLSNMPVRQETIPQATGQLSAYLPNKLSYIATLPVVSDFHAGIARYGDRNSELIYYPPGEYRWIDLLYDGPLDRLSFDFRYQLIDQSVHQIMLSPGDSVSLKIYFKSIYK